MSCFGRGRCKEDLGVCDCDRGWRGPFCEKAKRKGKAEPVAEKPVRGRAKRRGEDPSRTAEEARPDEVSADEARQAKEAAAYCPPQWAALPWWERYKPSGASDASAVIARLKACEQRPDPGVCVDTLVKLGEVRRPPFPGCEYRRPRP